MSEETNTDMRVHIARLEEKLHASETSLKLAKEAMEKRLDSMNEFRDTLKDQASKFVTRAEMFGFITTSMFLTIAIITLVQKFMHN